MPRPEPHRHLSRDTHTEAHPEAHQVLTPVQARWITMTRRWVDAVRESAPRLAALASV
jgi:hypothetical protein